MTGTRRDFFLKTFGAGALIADGLLSAQTPASVAKRIDVHHHVSPPKWVDELSSKGLATADITGWSVARTLDDMDKAGVETSIVSVTAPAVSFVDPKSAVRVARESNDWMAGLVRDHPGRFGFFALLPVQDIDASLREIEYALDKLGAAGVGLLTSYGDKWLGHASFAPLMHELNRRKAVLYTHPTVANCCRDLLPDIAPTVVEYGTDTSRTIVDIVFSGTAARCQDLQFIFSHGGGTLPYLTERLVQAPVINKALSPRVPNGVLHELKRFYYDTAWAAHPMALASLTRLVAASQILFGSDFPYRTGAATLQGLVDYGFSAADLKAITRDNSVRFLPDLRR